MTGASAAAQTYVEAEMRHLMQSDSNRAAPTDKRLHRVVVVGGGFAGLQAVHGLRRARVEVTLVDRQNYMLFQPLVYQDATGALSADEIAMPLRALLRRQRNARVLLAEVRGFDLERREVLLDQAPNNGRRAVIAYDTLIVAGGSRYSYFGHEEWQAHAPQLKSLGGALDIRSRLLTAFEAAELEPDPEQRQGWLTFVVVGAGPTGVEMAGQIAELAHDSLRRDFRYADTQTARVLLVEATGRVLRAFPEALSRHAARALVELGVTPLAGHTVVDIGPDAVAIQAPDGKVERVHARTAIWLPASPPPTSPPSSRARPASRSTALDASPFVPSSPCPDTRRCSRSATWSECRPPTARSHRCRASPQSRCSRVATPRARSTGGSAIRCRVRSATATRATSPPSDAREPSPTSKGCISPASPPGRSGSSSTSST